MVRLFFCTLCIAWLFGEAGGFGADATLFVYTTSDLHEHSGNLAQISAVVKDRRKLTPAVVFIDAGDFCNKGEEALAATRGEAMAKLLAACSYSAMILGNHDDVYGAQRMASLIDRYRLPVLAANATWADAVVPKTVKPWRMISAGDLRVAIVGTVSEIRTHRRGGLLTVRPALGALRSVVPTVRKQADLVIVVTHGTDDADEAIARSVPGVDLLVGGHTHKSYTQIVREGRRETLIWKGAPFGRALGEVLVTWTEGRLSSMRTRLIPILPRMRRDPAVASVRAAYVQSRGKKKDGTR